MKTGKALLAVVVALLSGTLLGLVLSPGKRANGRDKKAKKLQALAAELNRRIDQKFSELRSKVNIPGEKHSEDSNWRRKTESVH
ncbi:MAG TPA: hypothetical protein VF490_11085 [Chryseosolibacter sp.]